MNNVQISLDLCNSKCLTCSNETNCISCYPNATLNTLTSDCVCNDGFSMVILSSPCSANPCSQCVYQCGDGCQSCSNFSCIACFRGFYKYSLSETKNICVRCLNGCDSCLNGQTCINCTYGYLFDNQNLTCLLQCPTNLINFNNSCWIRCPDNLFWNNLTCVSNCPIFIDNDTKTCASICGSNQFLLGNICYNTCPQNFYGFNGTCVGNCPENFSIFDNMCVCLNGTFLYDSNCVSACPTHYYVNDSNSCVECNSICNTCFGPDDMKCLSCNSSQYLMQDSIYSTCVSLCPNYYYLNNETKSCLKCVDSCVKCTNKFECLVCNPYYELINGVCKIKVEIKGQLQVINNPLQFKVQFNILEWNSFIINGNQYFTAIEIDHFTLTKDFSYILSFSCSYNICIFDFYLTFNKTFANFEKSLFLTFLGEDKISSNSTYYYLNQTLNVSLNGVAMICLDTQYYSTSYYFFFTFLTNLF